MDFSQYIGLWLYTKRKNTPLLECFFFSYIVVAGPGFAPGSRGYEPLEMLLLYPAIFLYLLS